MKNSSIKNNSVGITIENCEWIIHESSSNVTPFSGNSTKEIEKLYANAKKKCNFTLGYKTNEYKIKMKINTKIYSLKWKKCYEYDEINKMQ